MNDSYSPDDRPYRPRSSDDNGNRPRSDNDNRSRSDNDNRPRSDNDNRPRRTGGNYGGNSDGNYNGGNDRRRREDVRDELFSTQVRAGRRRYFFDVRDTQSGDFYLTLTEVKRAFEGATLEKHKIFLYKEDFTKFIRGLQDTIDYVKSNLLTSEQLDELDRGDAQYEDDERYYREQRAQRAADDAYNAPHPERDRPTDY